MPGSITFDAKQLQVTSIDPQNDSLLNRHMNSNCDFERSKLAQEVLAEYAIPLNQLRTNDALNTFLPAVAASDDLALISGVHGTNTPTVETSDAKATTITQKARFLDTIPAEYDAGESFWYRIFAGMKTTVSDTTATIDMSVYKSDGDGGFSGSDLCLTAAQTINDLASANKLFQIDPTGFVRGDTLDVLITIAITDAATGTAVIGDFGFIHRLIDIKG